MKARVYEYDQTAERLTGYYVADWQASPLQRCVDLDQQPARVHQTIPLADCSDRLY